MVRNCSRILESLFSLASRLLDILFDAAVKRWGEKWRVRGIADPAGLPLLALIFSTLLFFAAPVLNTVGTHHRTRKQMLLGINTSREARWHGTSRAENRSPTRKLDPDAAGRIYRLSTIPAVAHAFAWRWIGKRQILPAGESPAPTTNPPLINELLVRGCPPLSGFTRVLRRRRGSESELALPNQH